MVDLDDGIRPVRLMPEPLFAYGMLGDIDQNGRLDLLDLVGIVNSFGPCPAPPAPCLADLTGNLTVDSADRTLAASLWN